jgi:hypothetical protein
MMLHVESAPITAAQIMENCPAKLTELGQHIAAHLEKAERCDQKADDHRLTAGRLLAQAKELCDDGGFIAFHERFCPNLGRSRTYDLLAIASGKKSVEEIRADNAERNRRLRARKKLAEGTVRHVTETPAIVHIESNETLSRVPTVVEADVVPLQRAASRPMSPDEFIDRVFPQLEVWRITLAEMAESNPAGARECVQRIAAELNAAIDDC